MVKALAFEVSANKAVKGARKEFLLAHGYYEFSFPNSRKADEFKEAVMKYLPDSAKVEE